MNLELKGAFGNDSRATDYGDQFVPPTPGINRHKGLQGVQRNFPPRTVRGHSKRKRSTDDLMSTRAWASPGETG